MLFAVHVNGLDVGWSRKTSSDSWRRWRVPSWVTWVRLKCRTDRRRKSWRHKFSRQQGYSIRRGSRGFCCTNSVRQRWHEWRRLEHGSLKSTLSKTISRSEPEETKLRSGHFYSKKSKYWSFFSYAYMHFTFHPSISPKRRCQYGLPTLSI